MKLLFDFFPILLFFLVYKLYVDIPAGAIAGVNLVLPFLALQAGEPSHAIYLATAVAIVASFVQVSVFWLQNRRFERMHLISLTLITVLGGATLVLADPLFIKWKPTVLNWVFALVFLGSQFVGRKPIVERLMSHAVSVPTAVWRRVNLGWVGFFLIAGFANIYVAYNFSEETWVDFKLFGLMGLTFAFVFAQALYLARYMDAQHSESGGP